MMSRLKLNVVCAAAWALWLGVAGSSSSARASEALADLPADRLYNRACGHAQRGHLDLAYELLKDAFLNGLAHPMQVATDPCLAPLIADSVWRKQVRELIHRHAWDENAVLAAPAKSGELVTLEIVVVDESGSKVPRAVVDLWQGDLLHPCALEGDWDPLHFATLRSGDSGQVRAETTLPVASGHGQSVPSSRHLHLSVERKGFEVLRGVLVLEGELKSEGSAGAPGLWWAKAGPKASGKRTFQAELRLSRTP